MGKLLLPCNLPERLKNKTEMLLVVEVPEETQAVEFVIRICIV